jgi:hypothetical protein
MVFGKKNRNSTNNISISIEGCKLNTVTHTKFLGVILDNELNWKHHISHISNKLSKSIGILKRARPFFNTKTLLQLYYSFLYPYLSYCSIIWGNAAHSTLWPIFRTQKHAIRIISNIRRRYSTKESFNKLKLLRQPDIYKMAALTCIYKFKNGLLPQIFDTFYTLNGEIHRYPTRAANQLRVPLTKSKQASSFIKKSGVLLWNSQTQELSHREKIGKFKRYIKTKFLDSYLNPQHDDPGRI